MRQKSNSLSWLRRRMPTSVTNFLQLLPKPSDQMPAEVRLRLSRLRKKIETEQSSRALSESKLTLSADEMPLAEVFEQVRKQTGNQLSDHREQFGQNATPSPVTIEIVDEPFWPALDKILDATKMTTYPFSGEDNLALINRDEGALPRAEGASYAGPFRIQATTVTARRDLQFRRSRDRLAWNWKSPGSRACVRLLCRNRSTPWK